MTQLKFAEIEWQPRWNCAQGVSSIDQNGSRVLLVTAMGYVTFDLNDSESIAVYCRQMRSAIDLLERTKAEYDAVMDGL